MSSASDGDFVSVRLDINDDNTEVAVLYVECEDNGDLQLVHTTEYTSPMEFATITMKQALTLYVKRGIVSRFPKVYTPDDPKVHSYVSKLSYEGIKFVAKHLDEFAKQFNEGKITLDIPKHSPVSLSIKKR